MFHVKHYCASRPIKRNARRKREARAHDSGLSGTGAFRNRSGIAVFWAALITWYGAFLCSPNHEFWHAFFQEFDRFSTYFRNHSRCHRLSCERQYKGGVVQICRVQRKRRHGVAKPNVNSTEFRVTRFEVGFQFGDSGVHPGKAAQGDTQEDIRWIIRVYASDSQGADSIPERLRLE